MFKIQGIKADNNMRVLFWVPPWPFNGDLDHFRNSTLKHLIPQANTLSRITNVSFALPDQFEDLEEYLDVNIDILKLSIETSILCSNEKDLYEKLYSELDGRLSKKTSELLREFLPKDIDVVMVWESPSNFFKILYPNILIINQMPGVFCRPPYPHTVTFDPTGLYRQGTLHKHAKDIQTGKGLSEQERQLTSKFSDAVRNTMAKFSSIANPILDKMEVFENISLLPLQISSHYNFSCDTDYQNQFDFLCDSLDSIPKDTGLIATQYKSNLYSETPLNEKIAKFFIKKYPNLIYDSEVDSKDSVSQYLLQHVDEVVTASSSVAMQGMIWNVRIKTKGDTFLKEYDTKNKSYVDIPWDDRCQNTLSMLLNKLNPLAYKVVQDEKFLFTLISKILDHHKAGKTGVDLLTSFHEIDSHYEQDLLNSFREKESHKALELDYFQDAEFFQIEKLYNLIQDKEIKAISFDLFDTLISRPFEKPSDLWKFMESEVLSLSSGKVVNFSINRGACEVLTRERLKDSHDEITLGNIYETLADFYNLPLEDFRQIQNYEIEQEVYSARPRSFGQKMFKIACDSGKPIYIVSDMYLPKNTVEKILEKCGYANQFHKLFLSSDLGCRKHSGKLFDLLLEDLNIPAKFLLHIGDNKQTDYVIPMQKKIRAFRWSSSIEWMRSNKAYKRVYPPRSGHGEIARSALAGTTAHGLFDAPVSADAKKTLTGGQPSRLGYGVLGPWLTGYMLWLAREAIRDGITDLFFLSREGWVLKEVFDVLTKNIKGAPRSHYMLASRRCVRMAACFSSSDVWAFASEPYTPGVTISELIKDRFGIEIGYEDVEYFNRSEVGSIDQAISRSVEWRNKINLVINRLMDQILTASAMERDGYVEYLKQINFYSSENPGVVDIGWKGNIQGYLGNIIDRRIYGYYYATISGTEKWIVKGDSHRAYAGTSISCTSQSKVVSNRHFIEFLTCHFSKSLEFISKDGRIHYKKEPELLKRIPVVRLMQLGAVQFAEDFNTGFGSYIDLIDIDVSLAESAISDLIADPSSFESDIFLGQLFEDSVGGVSKKYIVAPFNISSELYSVWKEGHRRRRNPIKKSSKIIANPTKAFKNNNFEESVVKYFLSESKYNKYKRDRKIFFQESKKSWVRLYGRINSDK